MIGAGQSMTKLFLEFRGDDSRFIKYQSYSIKEICDISGITQKTMRNRVAGIAYFDNNHLMKRKNEETRNYKSNAPRCQNKQQRLSALWLRKALV